MTQKRDGHEKLWEWFGLSRASFCVMPRVLMHEMPDEWQGKMADLLCEYDDKFRTEDLPGCKVMAVGGSGRFSRWPEWLLNYRRPQKDIDKFRRHACEGCGSVKYYCECVDDLLEEAKE